MSKDSPVVEETRKVRHAISHRFGNDPDSYIDYLMKKSGKEEDPSHPVDATDDQEDMRPES